MSIPRRILLHVAAGAGLVIAVATAVTYAMVYSAAKHRDLQHLATYVTERARREEAGFQQVQANLTLVRGQFLKRMESPVPSDYQEKWNARFRLFPDGAWRSREEFSDARKWSTLWAHKNAVLTPEWQTQILRAQDICNELLPGWVDTFPSVYFVLRGPANIGFDPRLPTWVWDTPADYDVSELEWFQLAMPKEKPPDRFAWTGVIEEPTTKMPIVSVYIPIEKDGAFLGSIGHDIFLSRLMQETARSELPGAMHVIFRADGRLVAHPTKHREIMASKGRLTMEGTGETALASLYAAVKGLRERYFSGYDRASQSYYCVARLAGPEWFFLTTIPRSILHEQAFKSAQWVLWSGLLSLGLVLALLAATLRRQIARPLEELSRATKQMSAGDHSARAAVAGGDEFGALAGSFNEMATRLAERDAALRAEKATLEQRVSERTSELLEITSRLRESEARFAAAFRHSPAMQSLLRASDRVLVEVNETFLQKLGFSREQVVGKTAADLNFWADPDALKDFGQELQANGFVLGREVRLRACDGRMLTVLLSTQPVDIGGVPHLLSAGVDITARKEAEAKILEGERQLRALYESLSAAVVVQDESGFIQMNSASLKLFGSTRPEDILGRHPADFSPPNQPDGESSAIAAGRHMERARVHGVDHFEWLACRLDGTHIPVEVTLTALQLGGRPVLQAVIIDLTERKRAETELQNALAKERELSQLKSEFVSLVSHEFRTPLEIIMSSTDNLQRYHDRLEAQRRNQLLNTIHKSVRRMAGMMEEVLLLGRLESDRMTFNPSMFDLRAFCQRVCEEIESATNRRCPIRLEMNGTPADACGDENVLRHVFANLLSNAVKYSPEGSEVTFTVSVDGQAAICQIADSGCGIPEMDQKRLFHAFHRGSNVGQVPGTGLGLLIVQRCVALHHGEIHFESTEGSGTTFSVRLPLFPSSPTPAPTLTHTHTQPNKPPDS